MRLLGIFRKKPKKVEVKRVDTINRNYVCLRSDPVNTVNDLRVGDWNMDKVQQSFAMGMMRYAKQSEVEKAKELGRIKE